MEKQIIFFRDRESIRIENDQKEEAGVVEIAGQISDIYEEFAEGIERAGSGGLKESAANWAIGNWAQNGRSDLCNRFLEDVRKHLEFLQSRFEEASQEEIREASRIVADVVTAPVPKMQDRKVRLTRRAVIGYAIPFLPNLDRDKLTEIYEGLHAAYKNNELYPVEKQVDKELKRLLR